VVSKTHSVFGISKISASFRYSKNAEGIFDTCDEAGVGPSGLPSKLKIADFQLSHRHPWRYHKKQEYNRNIKKEKNHNNKK